MSPSAYIAPQQKGEDDMAHDYKNPSSLFLDFCPTLQRAVEELCCHPNDPVSSVASPSLAKDLRCMTVPSKRPEKLSDVVDDTFAIFSQRIRINHPRFLGFVPSPASPISWLGDVITAACNVNAASWILSSGPSSIEYELISWLAEQLGLPSATAGGVFLSGGSIANMTAMIVARDQKLLPEQRHRAVIYVSCQTHSSIAKSLRNIGFLDSQICKLPADSDNRMVVSALSDAILHDLGAGRLPFAVVATFGTTNTGSIDPISELADICARNDLWLHVDGAYGASAALSGSHRHLIQGLGRADSISWDPHKWLFQTYDCSVVFVRRREHLLESFSNNPEYLVDLTAPDETPNLWNSTPELSRPARAMKLWFTMRVLGTEALGRMIDHGFELAKVAERTLRRFPAWEIVSPAQMSIVCFRYRPTGIGVDDDEAVLENLNRKISQLSISQNIAGIMTTTLQGKVVLRICAISPDLKLSEMEDIITKLDQLARQVSADLK